MFPVVAILLLGPQRHTVALPTAAEVVQRCHKAYDSVKSFEQSVTGTIDGSSGTAEISFLRPGHLRVSGNTLFGSKYDLVCDGKSTWVFNAGEWAEHESVELGIASITGISANAGTAVPSLLFHCAWGGPNTKNGPLSLSRVTLNGKPALKLTAPNPLPTAYWIDPQTYFLLQTRADSMGKAIVVVFGKPKVNQSIPASRFERPHGNPSGALSTPVDYRQNSQR